MLDTYKFIEKYKRISIIGMEKNVGKTTLLNKLIADIGKTKKLGLTSIGRDGEDIDVVTNTDKPRIYVREGSIIATGRDCLSKCDITKENFVCYKLHHSYGKYSFSQSFIRWLCGYCRTIL